MTEVHLRRITAAIEQACLDLRVGDDQVGFVATNAQSLAPAKANPGLVPLAIYDQAACGYPEPHVPMIGFVMYEIDCGVGFILRLMIDRAHQGKGYGRAALTEVIRRLRLEPEVEMIATSHRHDNAVMAALCRSLGFVPWQLRGMALKSGEVYLRLPSERAARSAPNSGMDLTALRAAAHAERYAHLAGGTVSRFVPPLGVNI